MSSDFLELPEFPPAGDWAEDDCCCCWVWDEDEALLELDDGRPPCDFTAEEP